jgi:para-nitrobenzyl esterase
MKSSPTIVNTKSGKLEGTYSNGIYSFKGIPYAAPPMGNLRWMPPQPVKPWEGIRPALKYGAIAPQSIMPATGVGSPDFSDQPQSEDCLFLNVWTSGLDDAKRPVMLWIHGGAFIMGSGSEAFFEGGNLPRRGNVVLVTINYRLGAWGFCNLKEITSGKIPATGNEGILDQIAAIDWVHDNIAAFGGNPDNITIFGFSAGGMSVGTLLAVPKAKGKFTKAINRSGAANVVSTLDDAVDISKKYLKIFGIKEKDTEGLRKLTTKQLLDGQQELNMILRESENRGTPFQPLVDGEILPDVPLASIKKGSAKNVTLLAGNTIDELKSMNMMNPAISKMNETELIKRLNKVLPPDMVPGLIVAYRITLMKQGERTIPADILSSINTDSMFWIPTIRLVEAQRDQGAPAYNYIFAYKSPAMGGALGAMHGLDNPLLFGSLDVEFTGKNTKVEEMANKIQDSCTAFAWTGNPSCKTIGDWPVYGKERMTMIFDINTRVEAAPFEAKRSAWDKYEALINKPI